MLVQVSYLTIAIHACRLTSPTHLLHLLIGITMTNDGTDDEDPFEGFISDEVNIAQNLTDNIDAQVPLMFSQH